VFVYALALAANRREDVLARVAFEPSGDAFNSIVFDERHHRPYNPMVNADASMVSRPPIGSMRSSMSRMPRCGLPLGVNLGRVADLEVEAA
jgi:glutaminase